MEEYKASKVFEAKIAEDLASAFAMGFNLYKAHMARLFLRVNVNRLNLEKSEDEIEEDGASVCVTSSMITRADEAEEDRANFAPISSTPLEMNLEDEVKEGGANIDSTLVATPATEPITTIDASIDHQLVVLII